MKTRITLLNLDNFLYKRSELMTAIRSASASQWEFSSLKFDDKLEELLFTTQIFGRNLIWNHPTFTAAHRSLQGTEYQNSLSISDNKQSASMTKRPNQNTNNSRVIIRKALLLELALTRFTQFSK